MAKTKPDVVVPQPAAGDARAADTDRIKQIRELFKERFDAARDHLIVQGLSIEIATIAFNALESGSGWRSPAGGCFGIR